MNMIREYWSHLMTPDDFSGRPREGVENQTLHVFLGLYACLTVCVVWAYLGGEMPYRWAVWPPLMLVYAGYIELKRQRWQGVDTVFDIFFVGYGVFAPLLILREVKINGQSYLAVNEATALGLLILLPVLLLGYALRLAKIKTKADFPPHTINQ